jgi:urease accessory protein
MKKTILIAIAFLLAVNPALAHLDPAEHGSFAAGFTHPLTGLDHIMAMIAVGLWAALLGGRALYVIPAAFVGFMIAGFTIAMVGIPLPYVEPVILASVFVLGLLVALALPIWVGLSAVIVGFFAVFHGYAHGGEIGGAEFVSYGVGFALATALLHVLGIAIGMVAGRQFAGERGRHVIRIAGGATAASGLMLMLG